MTRIREILQTYDKYELAFLYKYKYETYSLATRSIIDKYVLDKGYNREQLLQLTNEKRTFQDEEIRCPRCKSKKYLMHSEQLWARSTSAALDNYETTKIITCQICGFNIRDENRGKIKFVEKIKDWILKIRSKPHS